MRLTKKIKKEAVEYAISSLQEYKGGFICCYIDYYFFSNDLGNYRELTNEIFTFLLKENLITERQFDYYKRGSSIFPPAYYKKRIKLLKAYLESL